jgi:peptide deformylase
VNDNGGEGSPRLGTFAVLQYPRDALLLRRRARTIRADEFGTPELLRFAQQLGDTMLANRGIGLAATQVEEHPGGEVWAMFALGAGEGRFGIVCNPSIEDVGDLRIGPEACLSFASVPEALQAPEALTVVGQEPEQGKFFRLVLSGVLARAAWHEREHLASLLMIDNMSPMKKGLFLKAVAKARRR